MKIPCGKVVLAVVISLAASGPLLAQSDFGAISGYVNDPTGAAIPNAQIAVRNQSGLVRQATTNQVGFYSVTNLPPGFYTMTAESPGFEKYESKQNKLDPTAQLELDATLKVGASTQTVEVTAAAAVLQTESASVQKLVTRQ
ncbi:MAG: TonB-dependent receptor, partial [Acidobacteria bacterium]